MTSPRALWTLAACGLALLALAGCRPVARDAAPRHVLLVTVDTLRADHLSPYGYARDTSPFLARLADEGVLFERAIAQWPKTGPSFASMFTGRYPQSTGLTHKAAIQVPEVYPVLPELMQRQGFTTLGVVSNGVLGRRLGWDRGFDEYHETWRENPEPSDDPKSYRRYLEAGVVNRLALPAFERHRDTDRLFAWIHYSDPHAPYYLPEGVDNPFLDDEQYRPRGEARFENARATMVDGRRELEFYVAQYDANIRYVDRRLAELVDHLEALGLLEDCLIVVTADHGESLGEHGYYFGHGRLPYDPGSRVPLLLWHPRRWPEARRIATPVEVVDLLPTLLALVRDPEPVPDLEGEDLAPLWSGPPPEAPPLAFSEAGGGSPTTHFRAVQDGRWKLVYHPSLGRGERQRPATWELFDLATDPGETRDVAAEHPRELRRLRHHLRQWMKGEEWIRRSPEQVESYSQETLEALKALGYL